MQAVNVAEEEPIKVELVDDHSVFRHGMRELLEEDPGLRVVAEADTADSAVEKAIEYHPDVVLMDINLPLKNGIQATREIKAELPGTVVLVLSAFDADEQIIEALEAGAGGYLLKDDDPNTMLSAIHAASSGKLYLGPSLAKRVLQRLMKGREHKAAMAQGGRSELTPREIEILRWLVEGKKIREVARALGISERTMRNHLRNIFRKLGVTDRIQAILHAVRTGLVKL